MSIVKLIAGLDCADKTKNYYLQAVRQFCRWMVQNRRASESPLNHLKPLKVNKAQARQRRALDPQELGKRWRRAIRH